MRRRRDPNTIVIRNGWNHPDGPDVVIQVVGKVSVGHRTTHNGDGRFLRCVAKGEDGTMYETKSTGRGRWRAAIDQGQAARTYAEGGEA